MEQQPFNSKNLLKRFKKQKYIIAGITLIIILILVYTNNGKEVIPPAPEAAVDKNFSGVTPPKTTTAEVLENHLTSFEAGQQKTNQQLLDKVAQLESENSKYKQDAFNAESNANKINEKLAQLNTLKPNESSATTPVYKPQKMVVEDDINNDMEASAPVAATPPASTLQNVATYLPSNTFTKGVLIGSLSANTGGNASGTPTPVLIRLTDLAQLPNSFRSNIKSCMVGGSGFGDLSTERVKIRLTTMSCVLKDGKALDIPVDGYIDGEDSKAGIKGMVVTHSGSVAAKAALAGFLQGLGTVGQAMGQTQTMTPLGGVTTTISPSQAGYAGGGAGLSQVGSTLSQYYMSMMQQISPAIEVSAGRHITVVFTKGIELKLPINEDLITNQVLPLNQGDF